MSCSQDTSIKFWNINDAQCIKTLNGHTDHVYCLLLLENGHVASGSKDEKIKIWNMPTGVCIKTFEGHSDRIQPIIMNKLAVLRIKLQSYRI